MATFRLLAMLLSASDCVAAVNEEGVRSRKASVKRTAWVLEGLAGLGLLSDDWAVGTVGMAVGMAVEMAVGMVVGTSVGTLIAVASFAVVGMVVAARCGDPTSTWLSTHPEVMNIC